MDPLLTLLKRLTDQGVEFVIVGGFAANAYGSPVVTHDVDVCAPLDLGNLERIVAALRELHPTFRMRPDRLPLYDDPKRLVGFKNLNLRTDAGIIDILGSLPGVDTFADLAASAVTMNIGGVTCKVASLEALIASKSAAGREKDIRGVEHLKVIQNAIRQQPELFRSPAEDV